MFGGFKARLLIGIVRVVLFFWHPVLKVVGRENVPKDGRLMICANHSGMTDPIWIVFAMKSKFVPRIMAKKEVMQIPVLGWFLGKLGVFGVDRGAADVNAIKTGLRCLQNDEQLLVFPEGTRIKEGQEVQPKRGALMMAARTNTPVLPVYLTGKRRPFGPLTCIFGKPYMLEFEGKRPTDEELDNATRRLMEQIYQMGEQA